MMHSKKVEIEVKAAEASCSCFKLEEAKMQLSFKAFDDDVKDCKPNLWKAGRLQMLLVGELEALVVECVIVGAVSSCSEAFMKWSWPVEAGIVERALPSRDSAA